MASRSKSSDPDKVFRFRAGCVYLTYSQCPLPKTSVYLSFMGDVKWPSPIFKAGMKVAIAEEKHKDGNTHFHILAVFPEQFDKMITSKYFNIYGDGKEYHPNVQVTRSKAAVAGYISKEDKKPFLYGFPLNEWTSLVQAGQRSAKRKGTDASNSSALQAAPKGPKAGDRVADLVMNGSSLAEIVTAQPDLRGYVMLHARAIQYYQQVVGNISAPKPQFGEVWVPIGFDGGSTPRGRMKFVVEPDRKHRAKGIWIWGPTKIGKTSLIFEMQERGMIPYWYPYNNDHLQYQDGRYSFITMDEFSGGVPIYEMNAIMDGRPYQLNTKGGSVIKNDRLLVIITSNKEPKDCYPNTNPDVVKALMARFEIFHWPHRHTKEARIVIRGAPCAELQDVETEPEESDAEPDEDLPAGSPSNAPALKNLAIAAMEKKAESSSKADSDDGCPPSSKGDLDLVTDTEPSEEDDDDDVEEEEEEEPVRKAPRKVRFKSIFIDDEASE